MTAKENIPYAVKENYVTINPDVSFWSQHHNAKFIKQTIKKMGEKVVDFGCNHGALTMVMAQYGPEVIGVDRNKEAINTGKRTLEGCSEFVQNRVKFVNSEFEAIDIPDDYCSGAYMLDALEHVYESDRVRFFSEFKRVLKNGAIFCISVPYKKAYDDGFQHVAYFSTESLKHVLNELGLEIMQINMLEEFDKINAICKVVK